MKELKFPSLEQIKELPLLCEPDKFGDTYPIEYDFELFKVFKTIYCRFVYNEDGLGRLILDMMCDGNSDTFDFMPNFFDCTEEGYSKLQCLASEWYDEVMHNIEYSNEKLSNEWFK